MAKVWSTFSKNVKGSVVNFSIQEAGTDKIEDVVDMMFKYNIPEDPFVIASGVAKSSEALSEHMNLLKQMIGAEHQIDVVTLDNGAIVGASIMALSKKGDPEEDFGNLKFQNQELKKLFDIWGVFDKQFNVYKDKAASSYYDDWAFIVNPEYRGVGIEEEIFKARLTICKDKNVPKAFSWINQPGLAQAVEPFGWKVIKEINQKTLEKEAGVIFPDAFSTGFIMVANV